MNRTDLREIVDFINPGDLNYQEWLNVGMALEREGYSVDVWEDWSARDVSRYHTGECAKKWRGFSDQGNPVTGGTIVKMAMDLGWTPEPSESRALDWDDDIGRDDELKVVDSDWLEEQEVQEPTDSQWHPVKELVTYLETLFDSTDNVGYVTTSFEKEGRFMPTKGNWDRTSGELIQALQKCDGDIGAVLGDYNPDVGAWIRFNPLDGNGIKNENVTDFRYALVESDSMNLDKQNAIIRELELPVACLLFSGSKSVHAIVRVDAADYHEYRKRVDYLYDVCRKNGLDIDSQNRNPSRLSRMPGVTRGGHKQFLIDTNIGKKSWTEWVEWIESVNDDLPDFEGLAGVWNDMPPLSPALIDGVLRQGHKMLLAGPSKAGKSFALIELCCAIAEGRKWFEWQCAKGKVLYVNLELDRASCLNRFKGVYQALKWSPDHISNIDVWNLRGKSVPMDKLAPKLIRRALKNNYIAIVLDPIYKVITGDENSADQMSNFCNQFDKVCTELGSAVIYCHHHSKGSQGAKRSMDRASGSGVFARDPDALLDLIELDTDDSKGLIVQEQNKAACKAVIGWLDAHQSIGISGWRNKFSQDDLLSKRALLEGCRDLLSPDHFSSLSEAVSDAEALVKMYSAWRIDGTLREFPKFEPVNLWFRYPVHTLDDSGALSDIDPFEDTPAWKKNHSKDKPKTAEDKRKELRESIDKAYDCLGLEGDVTVDGMAEYFSKESRTIRNWINKSKGYYIKNNIVNRESYSESENEIK